jgi:hypothetical protein
MKLRSPHLELAVGLGFEHYKRCHTRLFNLLNSSSEFLDRYLDAQQRYSDLIHDDRKRRNLPANTVAGGHPTVSFFTVVVYYALMASTAQNEITGTLNYSIPRFTQALAIASVGLRYP